MEVATRLKPIAVIKAISCFTTMRNAICAYKIVIMIFLSNHFPSGGRGGSLEVSAMGILVVRLWACELQLGGKGTTDECAN